MHSREVAKTEITKLTENLTRRLWPAFKRQLETKFPSEEWIKCLYLLRAIRVSPAQVHLLGTLPANGRIIAAACNRVPAMRAMLAPSFTLSLTVYPDAYQVEEASRRYGLDYRPKAWARST